MAIVLATGAPLGLLLIRGVLAGRLSPDWAWTEVSGDVWTYGYVALSTMLVFAAFGYELGRQADRLYELSSTDPLTGLRNRRVMGERLGEELSRAERYGAAVSLLLIDLDDLKALNDARGHAAGDAALRETAAAIRQGSRATDIVARWGGDEFVVLAPSTGRPEAWQLAERIRVLVGGATTEASRSVTISVGVATREAGEPAGPADDLVARADAALYEAKRLGRNRAVLA